MKSVYKKYNSFFGIRIKNKYDLKIFLVNLKSVLNDKKNSLRVKEINNLQV